MNRSWVVAGLAALLFALQIAIRFHSSLGHDMAWYLYVADGLVDGKKLYVDFVEVNPPLGMWLDIPVIWLARALSVSPIFCFYSSIFLLVALSLAICWRYGREIEESRWTIFLLGAAAVMLFLPGEAFGQREHIMIMMVLPWLLLRQQNPAGFSALERMAVGAVAGLGIALKPYAICAPILVEAVLLFQNRSLRRTFAAENLAAGAAIVIYAGMIAILTPEFYSKIVELGRLAYIPYPGYPTIWLFLNAKWAVIFMALALFGWRNPRVQVLLAAAVGFLMSYALQGKGFHYHILPATALALLACLAALQLPFDSVRHQKLACAMAGFMALVMLVSEPQSYTQIKDMSARIDAVRTPAVQSVFIASNRFGHAFPYVVDQKLAWGSRFPTQWLAPYVAEHWKPDAPVTDPVVQNAMDWTMEDFAKLKPDIVAIDNTAAQRDLLGGFEFLKFWNSDPRFVALWKNYDLASSTGDIMIYTRKK